MSKRFNERITNPGAADPAPTAAASVTTTPSPATSSARTSVLGSSAGTQTLLNSNSLRRGATIFNNSNANLFLALGPNAATNNFTTKLGAGIYYEVPFNYTGIITGIWDGNNGNAQITEILP